MTYNVFSGTLNLTQSINKAYRDCVELAASSGNAFAVSGFAAY